MALRAALIRLLDRQAGGHTWPDAVALGCATVGTACCLVLAVAAVTLSACHPALVSYSAPVAPTTLSPADRAWIERVTNRVNDLVSCSDVTVKLCIDRIDAARKEQ